jgi:hypothetical protein
MSRPTDKDDGNSSVNDNTSKSNTQPKSKRQTLLKRNGIHGDSPLNWRMDPSRSLSDWTLQAVRKESGQVDTYHVHRVVLAVGPRGSDYFATVFSQTSLQESSTQTSRVELHEEAANVLPNLLDYMYPEITLDLSVLTFDQAFELVSLSEYFEIPGLIQAIAVEYFEERLEIKAMLHFLDRANQYQNRYRDPLLEAASHALWRDFSSMSPPQKQFVLQHEVEIADLFGLDFMLRLIQNYCSDALGKIEQAEECIWLLLHICLKANFQERVSIEAFFQDLSVSSEGQLFISTVSANDSLYLLVMGFRSTLPSGNENDDKGDIALSLSSFEQLCLDHLMKKWNELVQEESLENKVASVAQLEKLPHRVLTYLFENLSGDDLIGAFPSLDSFIAFSRRKSWV